MVLDTVLEFMEIKTMVFVICEDCKTSTDLYSTEAEAIAAWNRREK